jgi:low affinity Fe/Cu permease
MRDLAGDWANLRLQRYVATGHQHGTTVLTFLMVFVLQHSQNRDAVAIQAKLDELLLHTADARDDLVEAEKLTEKELEILREHRAKQVRAVPA